MIKAESSEVISASSTLAFRRHTPIPSYPVSCKSSRMEIASLVQKSGLCFILVVVPLQSCMNVHKISPTTAKACAALFLLTLDSQKETILSLELVQVSYAPLPKFAFFFLRILRCGRAPPTAFTSRRGTRSTAQSAAATCTRKVMGEFERGGRIVFADLRWFERLCLFNILVFLSQAEESVAEEEMHSKEWISHHFTRHSQ